MAHENATRQWPDAICSGPIRYGKADNYDGFYLADAAHGIPTFASVADASPATIRNQHVRVFNYPGQTEAIAAQLVDRWNAYDTLCAENERLRAENEKLSELADTQAEKLKGCPFDRDDFELDLDVPCPVCGTLGHLDSPNLCPYRPKAFGHPAFSEAQP